MRMARLMLVAISVCAAACATNPAPHPAPADSVPSTPYSAPPEVPVAPVEVREIPAAEASIPVPQERSIQSAMSMLTGELKASVQQSLLRSGKYKRMIDRVLAENRLPKVLAYLPVIESAYLPTLTSRAGARGIWQFMPQTAREYGLRVDSWVDERADPERATQAAAAYLKDLYREFHDWPLALAAYNAGAGRIHRALENTASSTYWELRERRAIPAETRGYVPTFFAAITIAGNPAAYGFRIGDPIDVPEIRVEVEGPISFDCLAELADVDQQLLRDLNPAYRRGVVPAGRASVIVPAPAAARLTAPRILAAGGM
jgi:membrane-bound lytic murein transglycosylase D